MPILNRFPFSTEKIVDGVNIFGVSWNGSSSTAWTRTDSSASFPNPVPYYSGSTSYNSKFDRYLPWRGMVIETLSDAGVCVKIPKFWYKITQHTSDPGMTIQIADYAASGFSVSPAHMNRGDGKGVRDYVYIGRYKCTTSSFKSVSGVATKTSVTRKDMRPGIHSLGSTVWPIDFPMVFTVWLLYLVEFADWDSQAKIGYGGVHRTGNNGTTNQYNSGFSDSIPYHTGTTQTSYATYGVAQYRWMEDLWGRSQDYIDGCYYASNQLYIVLNPSSFADSTSGGTAAGTLVSGIPTALTVYNPTGLFPLFLPTTAGGSNSTYTTDTWTYSTSIFSGPYLLWGNYGEQSLSAGLFSIGGVSSGTSGSGYGCRLMVLP